MALWLLAVVIFAAGALGGVVNALVTDNGFMRWRYDEVEGTRVWRPGWLGNVLIGAIAAFVSWGLYGRYSAVSVVGSDAGFTETMSSIAGAVLIGVGGARFLSARVDEKLLRLGGVRAASSHPNQEFATTLALGSPAEVWRQSATLDYTSPAGEPSHGND